MGREKGHSFPSASGIIQALSGLDVGHPHCAGQSTFLKLTNSNAKTSHSVLETPSQTHLEIML